ncbi:MAG: hypothetical protein WAT79_06385 [Saprospiraceae bacterium]
MIVSPSHFFDSIQSTTLIELNPNVIDTLVCEFDLIDINKYISKAWLNGKPINHGYEVVVK